MDGVEGMKRAGAAGPTFDVVIPTIGRASLRVLLDALVDQRSPVPGRILLVDDRRDPTTPLPGTLGPLERRIEVVRGRSAGPATARNVGWRASRAPWIAFLDDDVRPPPDWVDALLEDLRRLDADVGATQGKIRVPLPHDRRPTDWERNVAGLERACWATADMAYRREVLERVGGFDERFPRAYREDADLGLRVVRAGYRIVSGARWIEHPVRPADPWVSVRLQAGNQDDAMMRALHGPRWRVAAGVPPGRRPWHIATVVVGVLALVAPFLAPAPIAIAAGVGWGVLTADLAVRRIAPGPKTLREVATMVATSVVLPWAATVHWLRGLVRARRLSREPRPAAPALPSAERARAA